MFKEKEIRKHLIFSGRVQGVGFRYRAMNIAQTGADRLGEESLGRKGGDGSPGKTGRNWKDDLHAVSAEIYLD